MAGAHELGQLGAEGSQFHPVDMGDFPEEHGFWVPEDWGVQGVEVPYAGPFSAVIDVDYVTNTGAADSKTIIRRRPAPVVAAVQSRGGADHLLVTDQVRHGAGGVITELPGGMRKRGESFAEAAARNLTAETGVAVDPASLDQIDSLYRDPTRSSGLVVPVFHTRIPEGVETSSADGDPGRHVVGKAYWWNLKDAIRTVRQRRSSPPQDAILKATVGQLAMERYEVE